MTWLCQIINKAIQFYAFPNPLFQIIRKQSEIPNNLNSNFNRIKSGMGINPQNLEIAPTKRA